MENKDDIAFVDQIKLSPKNESEEAREKAFQWVSERIGSERGFTYKPPIWHYVIKDQLTK